MNLAARSTSPELMDDADLDTATYQRCLADLASLNRVTRTHHATLNWLAQTVKKLPPAAPISLLDIAYGQGDLLRAIADWASKHGRIIKLSGIDLNPRSAAAAAAATPPDQKIDFYSGDVFAYTPDPPVDFIVTSQFTHHLPDQDVVRLLRWMETHAARGWHIVDLHRHAVPYYGFRWLTRLMRWHRIVRIDGTISIARAFTRPEWQRFIAEAGVPAEITWQLPFRHAISRLK